VVTGALANEPHHRPTHGQTRQDAIKEGLLTLRPESLYPNKLNHPNTL